MLLTDTKVKEIKKFSKQIQIETIKMIAHLGVGHLGGSLSISDVLAVLYSGQMKYDPKNPKWEDRDWLVVSKGHSGPAVYSALALKGFFPMRELDTLNRPHTNLPSHCDRNRTPGIDMTTGSLGQGASTAAGVALAHKMNGSDNKTYLILGDGEIDEGQVWEMALFAGHRKLSNLIAFVDHNKLQLDGPTSQICDLGDIAAKFKEFGWYAQSVDGHDVEAINDAIDNAKKQTERPSMIVLNTIKGNGWSGSANKVSSHSMTVSEEQLLEALTEMEAVMENI
jgi:transketolase